VFGIVVTVPARSKALLSRAGFPCLDNLGGARFFCWILIVGGLLIMMGQHDRSEALFYYFRLEDQVPENHLLRLIDKHISFEFMRRQLKDSYSETGRPSIDPELLLRMLLIGYLYGITSEPKLVEELRMHLAWRWFTGLGFDRDLQSPNSARPTHKRPHSGQFEYPDRSSSLVQPTGGREGQLMRSMLGLSIFDQTWTHPK